MTAARQLHLFKGRRQRGRAAPLPKEFATHVAIADALRIGAVPGWLWSHFPAGEDRDEATGARLKRMGLKRGWPDFLLISPTGQLHALELKRGTAKLKPEQEAFEAWCQGHGVPHGVVRSFDEAIRQLTAWEAIRLTVAA